MFSPISRTVLACGLVLLPSSILAQEVLEPPPGMVVPGATEAEKDPAEDGDVVVARVGTAEIRLTQVIGDMYSLPEEQRESRPFDDLYEELLQYRIDRELVLQAAEASGVRQRPDYQQRMAELEKQVLTEMFIQNIVRAKLTPKVLQERYDQYLQDEAGRTQYRARHILAEDQAQAADFKARLDGGEDFEALARSLDYPGADRGGDLGFFNDGSMVPEIVETARALEVGAISAPFETRFGWHLIKLEETRVADAKPLETVREDLFNEMSREIALGVVDELRANVPVERFNRDGTPQDSAQGEDAASEE